MEVHAVLLATRQIEPRAAPNEKKTEECGFEAVEAQPQTRAETEAIILI
jgi:hypothetical protein